MFSLFFPNTAEGLRSDAINFQHLKHELTKVEVRCAKCDTIALVTEDVPVLNLNQVPPDSLTCGTCGQNLFFQMHAHEARAGGVIH